MQGQALGWQVRAYPSLGEGPADKTWRAAAVRARPAQASSQFVEFSKIEVSQIEVSQIELSETVD